MPTLSKTARTLRGHYAKFFYSTFSPSPTIARLAYAMDSLYNMQSSLYVVVYSNASSDNLMKCDLPYLRPLCAYPL